MSCPEKRGDFPPLPITFKIGIPQPPELSHFGTDKPDEREESFEHIWDVARRVIDPLLDDLVEVMRAMPEGFERAALNRVINDLDEQLIAKVEV